MYGPDLLVRPVWESGVSTVDVHLPEGRWIDAWSKTAIDGPTELSIAVPLHGIPLFVRARGAVVLGDLPDRWAAVRADIADRPDLERLAETVW